MSKVFSGITNLATGGLFGTNADNQSPFSYSPQVGQTMNTALQNYQDLYKNIGANQGGFVNAQIAPMQQANALGFGNLLQDQGLRGIRGSSFGNQDIANYQNLANTNIANQTANALMGQYGLQSGINQGIAGIGNTLAQQQLGAQGANTQIRQQNLAGNQANAQMFGGLMGGIGSLIGTGGGGGGSMPSPSSLAQFMALG
jgi:hypothetical protein